MTNSKWNLPDGTRMPCDFEGCEKDVYAMGWCTSHYRQHRVGADLTPLRSSTPLYLLSDGSRTPCALKGCLKGAVANGMCSSHNLAHSMPDISELMNIPVSENGSCAAREDCGNAPTSRGLCETHYMQWRRGVRWTHLKSDVPCPVPDCGRRMQASSSLCKRCRQLSWRYSLSPEKVIQLFAPGVRRCFNVDCLSPDNLHLDHSHACCPDGKFGTSHKKSCGSCVRGWLCRSCNLALGYLQENPRKIRGLLMYASRVR